MSQRCSAEGVGRDPDKLELAALRIVAEAVRDGLSLESTVELCLERTLACLELDFGCLYIRRHDYFIRVASRGLGLPQGPDRILPVADHRWLQHPFCARLGAILARAPSDLQGKAWMSVPLRIGKDMVGALLVGGYGLEAEELPTTACVQRVAGHLAVAIDNASRQQQHRELLDDTTDIVFRTDARGRLVFVNSAWEDVFGESVVVALGRRVSSYIVPDQRRTCGAGVETLVPAGKSSWRQSLPLLHRSGEPRWMDIHARLLRDDRDEVVGTAGVMRDVSQLVQQAGELSEANRELRAQAERLQQANHDLERLDRLKSEFLATVSHELRTPVAVIKGYTELLLDGVPIPLDDEQIEYVEMIGGHSEHLEALILQLLDLARIEAGAISVDAQPIPLRPVLEAAREQLSIQAAEAGIRLCPPDGVDVPLVLAEPGRLEQAAWCLLDNAVKFGHRGGTVWCELSLRDGPEPQFDDSPLHGPARYVQVTVRDNGIGLRPEWGDELFDTFLQADGGSERRHGGLGIGLGLGRALIELMGGQIALHSDGPDTGTTAAFTVPLAPRPSMDDPLTYNGNGKRLRAI